MRLAMASSRCSLQHAVVDPTMNHPLDRRSNRPVPSVKRWSDVRRHRGASQINLIVMSAPIPHQLPKCHTSFVRAS